jgi:hypothetical protein
VGTRASLDVFKKNIFCPYGDSNPKTSIPYQVAIIDYAAHEFNSPPVTIRGPGSSAGIETG